MARICNAFSRIAKTWGRYRAPSPLRNPVQSDQAHAPCRDRRPDSLDRSHSCPCRPLPSGRSLRRPLGAARDRRSAGIFTHDDVRTPYYDELFALQQSGDRRLRLRPPVVSLSRHAPRRLLRVPRPLPHSHVPQALPLTRVSPSPTSSPPSEAQSGHPAQTSTAAIRRWFPADALRARGNDTPEVRIVTGEMVGLPPSWAEPPSE